MNKKILLVIMLSISILFTMDVDAKVVSKDEIQNNTYIIGKYMFTRTPNEEYKYKGELTTSLLMLASKSIDGGIDNMIVYYKNLFGEWKNGATGEDIVAPEYFEITNRNTRDILQSPQMSCIFFPDSELNFASCDSAIYIDGKIHNDFSNEYKVEYYLLTDAEGNQPTKDAKYYNGSFFVDNTTLKTLETDFTGVYDDNKFYQVVSRFYYVDGEEKVYSEYSNVVSNGYLYKLQLTSAPILNAKITDVGLYKNPMDIRDITYYNVEFSLSNIDTDKYFVKRYEVYTNNAENNLIDNLESMSNVLGSDDLYIELYTEKLMSPLYSKPYIFAPPSYEYNLYYLTAIRDGATAIPEIYNDVSSEKTYSVRFDKIDNYNSNLGNKMYFAKIQICDKNDLSVCYNIITTPINASKDN